MENSFEKKDQIDELKELNRRIRFIQSVIENFNLGHEMVSDICEVEVRIRYKRTITREHNRSEVHINIPDPIKFKEFLAINLQELHIQLEKLSEKKELLERHLPNEKEEEFD